MTLNPYLNLDGSCRAAFEFYRSVFGGQFAVFQTFGEYEGDMEIGEDEADNVLHVSLPIGESVLMGSDVPAAFGSPPPSASNVHISYAPPSRAEADRVFSLLSDCGSVSMPLDETFWGSYFGACTDKFGTNWMINCESAA